MDPNLCDAEKKFVEKTTEKYIKVIHDKPLTNTNFKLEDMDELDDEEEKNDEGENKNEDEDKNIEKNVKEINEKWSLYIHIY